MSFNGNKRSYNEIQSNTTQKTHFAFRKCHSISLQVQISICIAQNLSIYLAVIRCLCIYVVNSELHMFEEHICNFKM